MVNNHVLDGGLDPVTRNVYRGFTQLEHGRIFQFVFWKRRNQRVSELQLNNWFTQLEHGGIFHGYAINIGM